MFQPQQQSETNNNSSNFEKAGPAVSPSNVTDNGGANDDDACDRGGSINSNSNNRRRVVWDETNLEHNKAYFDANPVTKHIDEPKTPYEPDRAMDEEGNFVDSEDEAEKRAKNPRQHYDEHGNLIGAHSDEEAAGAAAGEGGWDEETKSFARRARMAAPVVAGAVATPCPQTSSGLYSSSAQYDTASSPDQSEFKKRRTQKDLSGSLSLSLGAPLTAEEIKAREAAQHEAEFKHMRKAVYADEGAKFREQLRLAKLQAEEEEEDDDAN